VYLSPVYIPYLLNLFISHQFTSTLKDLVTFEQQDLLANLKTCPCHLQAYLLFVLTRLHTLLNSFISYQFTSTLKTWVTLSDRTHLQNLKTCPCHLQAYLLFVLTRFHTLLNSFISYQFTSTLKTLVTLSDRTYLQTSKHALVTYKLTYCLYSRDFIPYLILLSLTSLQALVKTWVAFEQHNLLTNFKTFLSSFTNLPILYLQVLITYLLKPFISYQFTCSKKILSYFWATELYLQT